MNPLAHISSSHQPPMKTFLACLALLLPLPVLSAVLHGQPPIDGGVRVFSNASAGAQNADHFMLADPGRIESITWWGSYEALDTDDFIVRILSDLADTPGPVLRDYQSIAVAAAPTSLADFYAAPVYRYDFILPDSLVLPSGSFYLSIMDETQNFGWHWLAGSGGDGGGWQRAGDGDAWSWQAGADLAFAINGARLTALAEPASPLLLMSGLLPMAVGFSRGRRKA